MFPAFQLFLRATSFPPHKSDRMSHGAYQEEQHLWAHELQENCSGKGIIWERRRRAARVTYSHTADGKQLFEQRLQRSGFCDKTQIAPRLHFIQLYTAFIYIEVQLQLFFKCTLSPSARRAPVGPGAPPFCSNSSFFNNRMLVCSTQLGAPRSHAGVPLTFKKVDKTTFPVIKGVPLAV